MKKDPLRVAHAKRAEEKAQKLFDAIHDLDRIPAEEYVRKNPPDVETIVGLFFLKQRRAAEASRPNALGDEIQKILDKNPEASTEDVVNSLRNRPVELEDWLLDVDEEEGNVVWKTKSGKLKVTTRTALANLISRVRYKNEMK